MDYTSGCFGGWDLTLHQYVIAVAISFEFALIAYRSWRGRQLDFVHLFAIRDVRTRREGGR
jgi:hypothetical protein